MLSGFAFGMKWFPLYRRAKIELGFLQIYCSALISGSCKGIVKREHTNMLPRWMKRRQNCLGWPWRVRPSAVSPELWSWTQASAFGKQASDSGIENEGRSYSRLSPLLERYLLWSNGYALRWSSPTTQDTRSCLLKSIYCGSACG